MGFLGIFRRGEGGEQSKQPEKEERQEKEEPIPYDKIFEKIEESERKIKEVKAEYKDRTPDAQEAVYLGGKVFDLKQEIKEFISQYLKKIFEDFLDIQDQELRAKISTLHSRIKDALKDFKLAEVRSLLEELRELKR